MACGLVSLSLSSSPHTQPRSKGHKLGECPPSLQLLPPHAQRLLARSPPRTPPPGTPLRCVLRPGPARQRQQRPPVRQPQQLQLPRALPAPALPFAAPAGGVDVGSLTRSGSCGIACPATSLQAARHRVNLGYKRASPPWSSILHPVLRPAKCSSTSGTFAATKFMSPATICRAYIRLGQPPNCPAKAVPSTTFAYIPPHLRCNAALRHLTHCCIHLCCSHTCKLLLPCSLGSPGSCRGGKDPM